MSKSPDPAYAGDEIYVSLVHHVRKTKAGRAAGDTKGFRVDLPHTESLYPDAAYFIGPRSRQKHFEGAPRFAVEVRRDESESESDRAATRRDYFIAGTEIVWDVDLQGEEVVRKFVANNAAYPEEIFRRGETADAEPAVPGWRMAVDDLFSPDADDGNSGKVA